MRIFLLSIFAAIYSVSGYAAMKITVEEFDVYFSAIPSEVILSHSKEHTEREMHRGVPKDLRYHLMVTVKKSKTNKRVKVSSIKLTVSGKGTKKISTKLEPMLLNGVFGYGKYFKLIGGGPFFADVFIKLSGRKQQLRARFKWWNLRIATQNPRSLVEELK